MVFVGGAGTTGVGGTSKVFVFECGVNFSDGERVRDAKVAGGVVMWLGR